MASFLSACRPSAGSPITGVVSDGDSITFGLHATHPYPYYFTANTGVTTNNQGVSGATLAGLYTRYSGTIAPLYSAGSANTLTIAAGSNDIASGTSAASLETTIQNYCSAARATGFKVWVATVLPRTDVTGGLETARTTYNAWLVANWTTFADGLMNFAAIPQAADYTNTTYYYTDQIHPIDALQTIMATTMQTSMGL